MKSLEDIYGPSGAKQGGVSGQADPAPTPGRGLTMRLRQALNARVACTEQERLTAQKAATRARRMLAEVAQRVQAQDPATREQLERWLGGASTARAVSARLEAVNAWLEQVKFECDREQTMRVQAHPQKAFSMRLGALFFTAPETGFGSQSGTLLCEAARVLTVQGEAPLDEGAGAELPAAQWLGCVQALKRVRTAPSQAVRDAENLQYFVEASYERLPSPME